MKHAMKAALMSALILPGAGQLWLKQWLAGVGFIAAGLILLEKLTSQVMDEANSVVDQVLNGQIGTDLSSLNAQVSQINDSASSGHLGLFFGIIWLVSVIHAYKVGAKRDKQIEQRKALEMGAIFSAAQQKNRR
ncbi:hypothetical protein ACFOD0_02725 [Shewanella intestini]|uniref:Uncharacterized protein n=1 Tax=Shewanella intestini TaxID=2017544 RepID=A0ABS5I6C1_9GAMM|nr:MULTISPECIES: hypothetical protein [Shewanella]MBR9729574.1 hypothetical protein [Shewanella intestini]MRG37644.1 hypothetical protein [Shewanella sp. XMDDZSB0408]